MRITSLPVTAGLALLSGCGPHVISEPVPAPTAGSRIRYAVRPDTNRFLSGRLVSLNADSLVVERPGDAGGQWVTAALPTDQIARLQVKVGRRDNIGRALLVGSGVGFALGALCAAGDEGEWLQPSAGECMAAGVGTGLVTGLLIGAVARSDVLAPVPLPGRPEP